MLFPDVDLVRTRDRDRWLTKHYRRLTDDSTFKRQPASLLPGGITFVTGFQQGRGCDDKNSAPEELIVEVDQAYFRQSLRKKVNLWFTQCGFDVTQPTISKAALVEAGLSSEAKVEIAAILPDQPEQKIEAADQSEKHQRAARKSGLVETAIAGCFPKGIPETLPNPELVQHIMKWLVDYCKGNDITLPAISPTTILRTSGRKDT